MLLKRKKADLRTVYTGPGPGTDIPCNVCGVHEGAGEGGVGTARVVACMVVSVSRSVTVQRLRQSVACNRTTFKVVTT